MAEETGNNEQAAEKKGGLSIKTIAMIGAILVIEGVVIAGAFMLNGGPAPVKAEGTGISELINDDDKRVDLDLLPGQRADLNFEVVVRVGHVSS